MDTPRGYISSAGCGLGAHGFGRLFHGEQYANGGVLTINDAMQVTDMSGIGAAGFDRENDLLGITAVFLVEIEPAVNALIGTFLLFNGAGADQA